MVENMAFFRDDTGRHHYPFGTSQLDSVRQHAGLQAADTFRVPIEAEVRCKRALGPCRGTIG
jgi:hypothetical protein